jgi:acyl-coenzyme A synthetase/AMP-(fatty) acid ligase
MMTLPLLPENSADLIVACHKGRQVTRATFLRDVAELAQSLPADRPLLNLCQDRYLFAVGLFAAISHGSLSLLPNAVTRETMNALQEREPTLLCLTDQAEAPFGLPLLHLAVDAEAATEILATPQIPAEQVVACVFTSGSTGLPQAHIKNFGTLVSISEMEAERLWSVTGAPCTVLGTVPFQHMYGLESTVLLTLLGSGVLFDQRPFYPADVADALAAMPMPRLLVTTPFHLRTLLDAQIELPPVTAILSATAPLARELAAEVEQRMGAPVLEIYGSTETGQIASRQVMRSEAWELFMGISITQSDGRFYASGGPLPQPQVLGDVLELLDERRFHLLGRGADMINIAGKRNSLAFLNNVILRLPGVRDAVFCLPAEGDSSRLAVFVVAPGVSAQVILQGLRDYVDPVFLPRPIVFVDQLARNATGKITAATVQELIDTHLRGKS